MLDQFISLLRLWGIPRKFARLSLTGGEPFIREDFFKLLERCFKNRDRFRYNILTNGTFINRETAKKLKGLGLNNVQVSLEGMEEVNDSIRGKGTFRKIIRAVGLLTGEGIHTAVSLTVHKGNVNEIPGVVELCKELGVNILGASRLVPYGRGSALKSEMLEPKEVKKYFISISNMNIKLRRENSRLTINTGCSNALSTTINPRFTSRGCSLAVDCLTPMPNGDVFPCRKLPIKVGNLREKTLFEIYYSSNMLWWMRDMSNLNPSCSECVYYPSCRGGARCMAYAYFNDVFAPDPQCWNLFKRLPEAEGINTAGVEKPTYL